MPYQIDWKENGGQVHYSGVLCNKDCIEANKEFTSGTRFSKINYIILNYNQVDQFNIDSTLIQHLAHTDANLYGKNPDLKLAFISTKKVVRGLVNMFQTHIDLSKTLGVWDMQLFETEKQAFDWVNNIKSYVARQESTSIMH